MTARVIKASASVRPPHADPRTTEFRASARVIAASTWGARVEGDRLLEAARSQAAAVLAKAESDATRLREEARAQGVAMANAEATATLVRARAAEVEAIERAVGVIAQASRAVAERIVGERLQLDDAALVAWIRSALAPIVGGRKITVRAEMQTIARLRGSIANLAPLARDGVELVIDATLAPLVVIARSELGEVRLELTMQVEALIGALSGGIAQAVRGNRG